MDEVLRLANRLRRRGIDCELDQYHESPPEGWPRWMVGQIETADYVIMVWTEGYEQRFKGKGKGGSEIEGKLITQEYLTEGKRDKYLPVVFSPEDSKFIPPMFRDMTIYDLSKAKDYEKMYNRIIGRPFIQKPPLGQITPIYESKAVTEVEFPLLEEVVDNTPTITIRGINGDRYTFHLFPFGERGSVLSKDVRKEIIAGLVKLVRELGEECDYIVGIKEGGFAWAEHVANVLDKNTNTFYEKETERGKKQKEKLIKGEKSVHLKTVLYEKDLYYRDFKAGDRVIIIDDVISSGQTMQTLIRALKKVGVKVLASICIVAKTNGYKIVEAEEVPVLWLQYVRGLA